VCLAVPGLVVEVLGTDPELRWGWVEFSGLRRQVALACVPEAEPGDYVLVHAGIALTRIDGAEAARVLAEVAQTSEDGTDAIP